MLAGLLPAAEKAGVEVLVSDNCSTDGTPAVVSRFSAFNCLRSVRNPENLGFDGNILNLFDKAAGRFLWLMGDDDKIEAARLGEVAALLEENRDKALCFLNFRSDTKNQRLMAAGRGLNYKMTGAQSFADHYLHWATLISTNIINLAAASDLRPDPACLGPGWIHVHLLLLLLDRLKREGGQVMVVKDRVVVQGAENNIRPMAEWETIFVDRFSFTLDRTELTELNIAGFKRRFYDINIRPRYLTLKDIAALAAPREFGRKVEALFHPNAFARASFYLQLKLAGRGQNKDR